MLSLLEQIDQGTLWPYSGGIHPLDNKHLSNKTHIDRLPLAEQFVIPVPTVGQNCVLRHKVGDRVLKGEPLTEGNGHLPAHAPTSGVITAVEPRVSNHPSALAVLSVVLEADGKDQWVTLSSNDTDELTNAQMLTQIRESGIAGMGGAAFPSHIKLNPVSDIELVIINGIECEPYITSDDRLMREYAEDIIKGMTYIDKLLDPLRFIIAIEDNKPESAQAMSKALAKYGSLASKARVTVVPTKYPSGGEKQLIQILTGKEVPSGGIPAQLGIVVHNVGTAMAIGEAIEQQKPLVERVVTITGENVVKPGNYWVPIGTPIAHLLESVGIKDNKNLKLFVGGPMMGHMQADLAAPILKGSNCIIAPSATEFTTDSEERACIRCGECAVACPAGLLPQQLFWHSKAEEYDKAASYNLKDCIECGCCSYVCPSDIPLVEYYRVAKSAIRKEQQEKIAAEQAKKRFDARLARLEKEKLEREEKAKKAAERRKANMSTGDKGAVAAALARVKAKKAAEDSSQPDDKQSQVAAAIARAKAKKAASTKSTDDITTDKSTDADDKKAQIAAAVARAKAKKLAKAQISESETTELETESQASTNETDKQAKIKAAIERAKAKKLAKQSTAQSAEADTNENSDPVEALSAEAQKKAKIAAAVAKAKAKKAQKENTELAVEEPEPEMTQPLSAEEQKKAKIAAAVAKAKAKKAQKENIEFAVEEPEPETTQPLSAEEQKKAKIAAAVAKAKAKKLARKEQ